VRNWCQSTLDHWLVPVRHILGEESTSVAWESGRTTSVDQATELALGPMGASPDDSNRQQDHSRQPLAELSPREQQVAALLAKGLTNRQIAEQLIVTQRTVASHIEHILEKLGFASRHQVGAWAAEHGLKAEK
jgi:DNA-binding NarL/FixJ family response regulator